MQTSYITNNSQGVPVLVDGNINLNQPYYITNAGIYIVTSLGSGASLFLNSYNPSTANGQTVIIVNQDPSGSVNTDIPEYPLLDPGIVYKFVSDGIAWRNVSTPGAMYANGSLPGNIDNILTKPGVYVTPGEKPEVTLPNASEFDGQTIILFNTQDIYTCDVNGGVYDFENNYQDPFAMSTYSMLKVKSVGGSWRIVKYLFA